MRIQQDHDLPDDTSSGSDKSEHFIKSTLQGFKRGNSNQRVKNPLLIQSRDWNQLKNEVDYKLVIPETGDEDLLRDQEVLTPSGLLNASEFVLSNSNTNNNSVDLSQIMGNENSIDLDMPFDKKKLLGESTFERCNSYEEFVT